MGSWNAGSRAAVGGPCKGVALAARVGRPPHHEGTFPMTSWPASWPPAAHDLADAVLRLTEATARDAEDVEPAIAALVALPVRVEDVVAGMLRLLLEAAFADGVDSDDVSALVRQVAHRSPALDPTDVVAVVLGTLGVHPEPERRDVDVQDPGSQDPDDVPAPVTVDRLAPDIALRVGSAVAVVLAERVGTPLAPVITAVLSDVAAAESVEWA